MTLRQLCREHHPTLTATCHRMAAHSGPHISRRWRHDRCPVTGKHGCWCSTNDVRWYAVVEYGVRAV